ncbi:uncharacterized protein K02A2.6-like [Chelonus insularis]|uniref:uncharacterized protein K02A2.6-like n=1 Tax=Chelonus insularis TaxID=460826 RepID=UPI00158CBA2D|nr:uncharacterized protein K02A2.6-like [Chelonus insularis]
MTRSHVWWPEIDADIERANRACEWCQEEGPNPPRVKLHGWKRPEGPNDRIYADFLGPVNGSMFMIIVDAFSKLVDVRKLKDITSNAAIEFLKDYMVTWRLPLKLVTDNEPAYASREFANFTVKYGI